MLIIAIGRFRRFYDADTGQRSRTVTWTDEEGRTATRDTEVNRTDDGFEGTVTTTDPDGNSRERIVTGSYDPETGTWTREVSRGEQGGGDEAEE